MITEILTQRPDRQGTPDGSQLGDRERFAELFRGGAEVEIEVLGFAAPGLPLASRAIRPPRRAARLVSDFVPELAEPTEAAGLCAGRGALGRMHFSSPDRVPGNGPVR